MVAAGNKTIIFRIHGFIGCGKCMEWAKDLFYFPAVIVWYSIY